MSRGISDQQRRILGLAYGMNVAMNGAYTTPTPDRLPDFFPWMLEHFIGGVPLKSPYSHGYYTGTAEHASVKASLRRAVSNLYKRGLLVDHTTKYAPKLHPIEKYAPGWVDGEVWGYVLTPDGAALAQPFALSVDLSVVREYSLAKWTRWVPAEVRNQLSATEVSNDTSVTLIDAESSLSVTDSRKAEPVTLIELSS